MSEWCEYRGAVHVHTAYSDSAGGMPYVLDCARKAGLDYVVVSDHNSLVARQEGWEGRHDGVLLVIAVEITSVHGHALALGLDHCPYWRYTEPDDYLPEVRRLGGTAFIAHPERSQRGKLYRQRQRWPDLETDEYAGVEIWSYMHDWIEGVYPFHPIRGVREPDSFIIGPHPDVLAAWDREAMRRHSAGLGALDAHELRLPVPGLCWWLVRTISLEHQFRTVRTHVLTRRWGDDAGADIAGLCEALAAGRAFTAYDWVGDSTGARFEARRDGRVVAVMGDEIACGGETEFAARVPREAELTILRDGDVAAKGRGTELVHRDARAGVYRFEARLDGRPWVFSNHVYVR